MGIWKGDGAGAGATTDVTRIGVLDYNDLATQTTPITVLAATPTTVENDALGPFTNKTYTLADVADVYDGTTDTFDWSSLELGDMVDIRVDLLLTTASPNTTVSVELQLGTGAGTYTIPFIADKELKNATDHQLNRFNGIYMGDLNTLNNGGCFIITTDKAATLVVNGWYCKVIKRNQ